MKGQPYFITALKQSLFHVRATMNALQSLQSSRHMQIYSKGDYMPKEGTRVFKKQLLAILALLENRGECDIAEQLRYTIIDFETFFEEVQE